MFVREALIRVTYKIQAVIHVRSQRLITFLDFRSYERAIFTRINLKHFTMIGMNPKAE